MVKAKLTHEEADRQAYTGEITNILMQTILKFDKDIGKAVKAVCRDPHTLTDAQAYRIVQEHSDVLRRAYYGTTLVGALVNQSQQAVWVVNLGDSTVGARLLEIDVWAINPLTHATPLLLLPLISAFVHKS